MSIYHTKNHIMIDHFTLLVKDIEKSLEFYQNVLGLDYISSDEKDYHLGVGNKVLFTLKTLDKVIPNNRTTGLYHFALLVPNRKYLGQLLYHFLKNETRITGGSNHGVSEAIYLNDPDNNGIEIYADTNDTTWQFTDSEINMVTEPLDYYDLLNNRYSDDPFKMPEGTIIGHMHFHVNNLIKAANFFIDVIGFQQMLNAHSAIFLSDGNYHHHLGINIWNGLSAKNREDNMVGLVDYHLNVPEAKMNSFIENLRENHVVVLSDQFGRFIYDVNKVKVYF